MQGGDEPVREILVEGPNGVMERWVVLPDGARVPAAYYEAPKRLAALEAATRRKVRAQESWSAAITAASEAGLSLRDIAEAAGVSHVAISKRLRKDSRQAHFISPPK